MADLLSLLANTTKPEEAKRIWAESRWEDVANFIGPNAAKYEKAWQKQREAMVANGKPAFAMTFCWTALLFLAIPWAIARKQYPWAGLAAFILVLINLINIPTSALAWMPILMAMTVKNYYIQQVVNQIAKIDASGVTGADRDKAIQAAGGLDVRAGVIAAVGVLVLFVAANFFGLIR